MTYPQTEWDFGAELPLSPENMWGATPETDVEVDSDTESDHINSSSIPVPISPPRIPKNLPRGTKMDWFTRLTWEVDLDGRRHAVLTVITIANGQTLVHQVTPFFFPDPASLPPSLPVAESLCSQRTQAASSR